MFGFLHWIRSFWWKEEKKETELEKNIKIVKAAQYERKKVLEQTREAPARMTKD